MLKEGGVKNFKNFVISGLSILFMCLINAIQAQNTFTVSELQADSASITIKLEATRVEAQTTEVNYTKTDSLLAGIVRTDTLCSTKDLCVHQDARVSGDLSVFGNARLKSGSALVFEGNQTAMMGKQISLPLGNVQLLSAIPTSVLSPTDPIDIDPCLTPTAIVTPTVSTGFTAMSPGKGSVSLFSASWDGSGFLEVSGGDALLVNYFCGKDILLGTGTGTTETLSGSGRSGSKIYTGDYVEMRKHLQIGGPVYGIVGDPNNVALEVHTNSGEGIRVKTYTVDDPELSVMNTNTTSGVGYNGRRTFAVYGDGKMRIRSLNDVEPMISVGKYMTQNGTDLGNEYFKVYADGRTEWMASSGSQTMLSVRNASNNVVFRVMGDGKTVIGTQYKTNVHNDALLQVSGKVVVKEFFVTTQSWADDVFYENYSIPDLKELEKFYKKHKHLPNIPSAKDVLQNGINVGEILPELLRKIEELTIIVVNQQKEIIHLREKIEMNK